MRNSPTRGWLQSIAATSAVALLLGTVAAPVMAGPDDELIWEEGTVTSIADGDTISANLTGGSGLRGERRIRTIGVQAPEVAHPGTPADCGSAEPTNRLAAQLPVGAAVQTRSVSVASNDDYSGGRIVRSLYAQDPEGNWYDTSRGTVSDGWLLWFPLAADSGNKPEWAHNLEYRVLADDAFGQGRGLWGANLCGSWRYPDLDVKIWARYYGTEKVYIQNNGATAIDLSGWIVRDSALNGYRTLAAGTVIAGGGAVREVYSGDLNLNNLPASNAAFEGDAVYLLEPAGPYGTGNLRGWFPYPCSPDDCTDPLKGQITITSVQDASPAPRKPSRPGSVSATASTDGTGNVTVTWAAPNDLGAASVTYNVNASSVNGGALPTPNPATGVTGLSYTFTGLTLGAAYTFTVTATNAADTSGASGASDPVAPVGTPDAPTTLVTEPRSATSAVISWTAPAVTRGPSPIPYTATATETTPVFGSPPIVRTCSTTDGSTSCVITDLTAVPYTVTVHAGSGPGTSGESAPASVTPVPYVPGAPNGNPGKPTAVVASALDGGAVVSWTRPTNDGGAQITTYSVSASPQVGGTTKTCQTTGATAGATSCVVTGLTNGIAYSFTVVATNTNSEISGASNASEAVTPSHVVGQGPTNPGTAPEAVADPYVPGEYVEVQNASGDTVQLGGYGIWDKESSSFVNGTNVEDRAAYLFPADQVLAAGQKLRVHFGGTPSPQPGAPTSTAYTWTNEPEFIGSTDDFVELAHLNRASLDCRTTPGGSCRTAAQVSIPTPPVGVTARTSTSVVTVTWGGPISRGGTAITGYTATAYNAAIGGSPIASCTAGGSPSGGTCSFVGGIGTRYYVDVVAANAVGISGPSWRVLAAPKTVPTAPGNVAVTGTPGGVNVTWSPAAENGAAITKYSAAAYTAGTGGSPVGTCTTSNGSMGGCTIMKLQGGTQYFIDVTATNRAGNGAPSSPRVAGEPGPGGAVSTYSKGRVTVRWDPPTPGSNTITGYTAKLYTKSSGGTKVGECSAAAGATSCRTKKMRKRSKYYIDLTMASAAGTFTVKPRIVTGPPKRASAPKVTSATAAGRHVAIAWAQPSFHGYSYLKGYGARLYSKSKGGSVKASCTAGAGILTCTTKPVKKKGTYYASARVKNAKGWSKWSSKRVKVIVR